MKIGRREHLRQLGLGAAGILGAGLFENDLGLIRTPRLKARPWPFVNSPPADVNPGIRMLFAGMMVFTYKGRQGRVVFHTGSTNHTLEIIVFQRGASCEEKLRRKDTEIPAKIELISPLGHADDVGYFQMGDPDDFDRKKWDCKDFRWLLDLEGPETYSNKDLRITKDKGFNKKLHVRSGLFYTYLRTTSRFTSDVGSLMCPEFSVARFMACDIPLTGRETFTLKVGGDEVSMQFPAKYEIYFLNTCQSCSESDFPMVFDAVEDGEAYKFDLKLATPGPSCSPGALCYPIETRSNDEAPCMGAGFGSGRGWP